MKRLSSILLALGVASVGCGDNIVGAIPEDVLTPRDGGSEDPNRDGGVSTYPAGPYGANVGDILENASFAGYVVNQPMSDIASTGYLPSVTFEDLRAIDGYDFLLLNVAADWCAECKLEAREFPNQFGRWAPKGGMLISIVIEDNNTLPATKVVLDNWVGSQAPTYTTLHDPNGFINREFAPATLPMNAVIDLRTMEILRSQIGTDPAVFNFFEASLDQ